MPTNAHALSLTAIRRPTTKFCNAQCNSQSSVLYVSGPLFNPMSHIFHRIHYYMFTIKKKNRMSSPTLYISHTFIPVEIYTHRCSCVWLLATRTFYSCVTTMWSIVYSRLPCEQLTIERQCLKLVRASVLHQCSMYCTCKQNFIVVMEKESAHNQFLSLFVLLLNSFIIF